MEMERFEDRSGLWEHLGIVWSVDKGLFKCLRLPPPWRGLSKALGCPEGGTGELLWTQRLSSLIQLLLTQVWNEMIRANKCVWVVIGSVDI